MQFARDAHHLLDLLHARQALSLAAPQVVLDADAHMQAHRDGHRVQRQHVAHQALDGQHCVLGAAVDELHQVARVRAVGTAADGHPVQHQRAGIDAAADQPLDRLQLADVILQNSPVVEVNRGSMKLRFAVDMLA